MRQASNLFRYARKQVFDVFFGHMEVKILVIEVKRYLDRLCEKTQELPKRSPERLSAQILDLSLSFDGGRYPSESAFISTRCLDDLNRLQSRRLDFHKIYRDALIHHAGQDGSRDY